MKGVVLDFSDDTSEGLISAEDGHRYSFKGIDWRPDRFPGSGMHVDFVVDGERAVNIYIDPHRAKSADKNRMAAALLAIFFGYLGFHKFYLGLTRAGAITISVSLLGAILVLPLLIMAVIGFIEFIIYITMSDDEFERTYVAGRKEWF